MDNFDIRKFLNENSLTSVSRLMNEDIENDSRRLKNIIDGIASGKIPTKAIESKLKASEADQETGTSKLSGHYTIGFKYEGESYSLLVDDVYGEFGHKGEPKPSTYLDAPEYPEPDYDTLEFEDLGSVNLLIANGITKDLGEFSSLPEDFMLGLSEDTLTDFLFKTAPEPEF